MSKYLLDTHTLIWLYEDSENISVSTRKTLEASDVLLYLSTASFWEIAIKQQIGKLDRVPRLDDYAGYCINNYITILPISMYYLNQYTTLPLIHRDPFDRMIVATAYCDGLTLVSKDKQLSAYNIEVIW